MAPRRATVASVAGAAAAAVVVAGLVLAAGGGGLGLPQMQHAAAQLGRRLVAISVPAQGPGGGAGAGDDAEGDAEGDFLRWMANAGLGRGWGREGGAGAGPRGLQELRDKVLLRLLAFCYDVLPPAARGPYEEDFAELVGTDVDLHAPRALTEAEQMIKEHLHEEQAAAGPSSAPASQYFGFIPAFVGRAVPGRAAVSWESPCWTTVTAEAEKVKDGWALHVRVSKAKHLLCSDMYVFATASGLRVGVFPAPIGGTKTYLFKSSSLTESEVWDVSTLGIRALRFVSSPLNTVRSLLETLLLFVPTLTKTDPPLALQRNLDFLKTYAGMTHRKRVDPGGILVNESEIHSGDFFGILRLDGLDPMLAWGTGSRTGHTTVALWEDGELFVAESTVNSTYWPTNGIQRTPYREWIERARKAKYSVVHVPLAAKYRSRFDAEAANAFFQRYQGLQYGYHALLSGWIDTKSQNYPCIPPYEDTPPEDKQCLTWELLEVAAPVVTRFMPWMERPFVPSWNLHLTGSSFSGLSVTQLYKLATEKGIELASIPAIVEESFAMYPSIYNNGTRAPGPAMVCDVFVCEVWKAGGVFKEIGDEFSCAEQMNTDVYDLRVLEAPRERPATCKGADPDNALCQLTGDYELLLPRAGTRGMYKHMQETCPTEPPRYDRPDNC